MNAKTSFMPLKVLLTGANGQLGRSVQDVFRGTDHKLIALDRLGLNVADGALVARTIKRYQPDVIVNAAAYTAVDKAESEPELAAQINSQGPANLASAAQASGALLIHISTDYVFDGSKSTPYTEDDATAPLSVYGLTKLTGEQQVRKRCEQHVILRTAWVFSEFGNNFVKTMLRLGASGNALRVVEDQRGCPTYAGDIAQACLAICEAQQRGHVEYGVYHFVGHEPTSWYGFANAIFDEAVAQQKLNGAPVIAAITTDQYPTPAVRPKSSVLSSERFMRAFGQVHNRWYDGLVRTVELAA